MSQQFVVVRGQIGEGKKVLAKLGAPFKPRSKKEQEHLLAAGVIAPVIDAEEELLDDEGEDEQGDKDGDQPAPPEPTVTKPPETPPAKPAAPRRPRK